MSNESRRDGTAWPATLEEALQAVHDRKTHGWYPLGIGMSEAFMVDLITRVQALEGRP